MDNPPKIYVACLASYNAGVLYGEWFDVDIDADDLAEQITVMLADSSSPGAEEYAIHDHDGFCGVEIGEYSSLAEVCQAAELIEKHGAIFGAACSAFGSVNEAINAMERYCGAYDSAADYAEGYAEDCGDLANVPNQIRYAINWSHYADNLCLTEVRMGAKVHIFTE